MANTLCASTIHVHELYAEFNVDHFIVQLNGYACLTKFHMALASHTRYTLTRSTCGRIALPLVRVQVAEQLGLAQQPVAGGTRVRRRHQIAGLVVHHIHAGIVHVRRPLTVGGHSAGNSCKRNKEHGMYVITAFGLNAQ